MRTLAAVTGALAVAAALAQDGGSPQGRTRRGTADAGPSRTRTPGPVLLGTDPPGQLRTTATDGGAPAQQDGGATHVELELQQLRSRVDALERERGELQRQSQQLEEVVRQLQELRTQVADAEARRQAEEQQQIARREALQAGVNAVAQAQAMLAGGNSSVDAQLAQAQASFPPQAQRDLQAAREALRNRDLALARTYLNAAIANAQQGR